MSKRKQTVDLVFIINKAILGLFTGNYEQMMDHDGFIYSFMGKCNLSLFDFAVLETLNSLYLEYETLKKISYTELAHLLTGNRKLRVDRDKKKNNSITISLLKKSLTKLNSMNIKVEKKDIFRYKRELINCRIDDDHFQFNNCPSLLELYYMPFIDIANIVIDSNVIRVTDDNNKSFHDNVESISTKFYIIENLMTESISKIQIEDIRRISGLNDKIARIYKRNSKNSDFAFKNARREIKKFKDLYLVAFPSQLVKQNIIKDFKVQKLEICFIKA